MTDHHTEMLERALVLIRHYVSCHACAGSGLSLNMAGEPDTCRECKGDTVVRNRDAHGRFIGNSKATQP